MAKQTLIITDNEVMATTIAKAVGYDENEKGWTAYTGADIEILWTGGMLIDLVLKDHVEVATDTNTMSATEIAAKYYTAIPRRSYGKIVGIDMERLKCIEDALHYCDEIIFMCQPTDEGEKLTQAILMFFGINIETNIIKGLKMIKESIKDSIANADGYKHIVEFQSAEAMRRNVNHDVSRQRMTKVGQEEVSPKAMRLLESIQFIVRNKRGSLFKDKAREVTVGGRMDFNTLFCAMASKYDMVVDSLWDSLLYLYAQGLITNPMTCLDHYPCEWIDGAGSPINTHPKASGLNRIDLNGGIVPIGEVEKSLMSISYDYEDAPDDFMPRTGAIYRFIVEQAKAIENGTKFESIEYPSFKDSEAIHVNAIYEWYRSIEITSFSMGLNESFGRMIYELEVAELIQMTDGLVKVMS